MSTGFDQSKRARSLFSGSTSGGGHGGREFEKNVLLIIDPQNDFSDARAPHRAAPGSLQVPGASDDYRRIIQFIQDHNDEIDEVHVSLDTHTSRHIGHPSFWDVLDDNGVQTHATDAIGLSILKISSDNIITGFNILDNKNRTFIPRRYDVDSYPILCRYVYDYLHFYDQDKDGNFLPANKHGQLAWIWKDHCLEETEGHKVAVELRAVLDEFSRSQAESPVPESLYEPLRSYLYTGLETGNSHEKTGAVSYDDAKKSLNLETKLNTNLMDQLLGRNNRVLICGEARTHCVKSSSIDLMEYAQTKGISDKRIVLMPEMSSPIPGVSDDIEAITIQKGFCVHRE